MRSLPRLGNSSVSALGALVSLVLLALLAVAPAQASLGKLKTTRIFTDSLRGDTPTTWNPHLPKMASSHGWDYFVFTRGSSIGPAYDRRRAWVLKRREGTRKWVRTGRVLTNFINMPGLLIDSAGRLHLVFSCLGNHSCSSDGVNGYGVSTSRFHDLVFGSRNRDGSFRLSAPPVDEYPNTGGPTDETCGYLGVGTDPTTGETFGSTLFPTQAGDPCLGGDWGGNPDALVGRRLFGLGTSSSLRLMPPKVDNGTVALYPQLAISPAGVRYYTANEWLPGDSDKPYAGFGLSRWSDAGIGTVLFSDRVDNVGRTAAGAFASDMSFGPRGELYLLYQKYEGPGRCMSYLVKESGPASGVFSAPVPVGCHVLWAQLQVDSRGRIYIVEQSYPGSLGRLGVAYARRHHGPQLLVFESDDGGSSWKRRSISVPRGPNGLPRQSTDTWEATLVKPWGDPAGYDPDKLHGFFANWRRGPLCNWLEPSSPKARCGWSAVEFTIPIRGESRRADSNR